MEGGAVNSQHKSQAASTGAPHGLIRPSPANSPTRNATPTNSAARLG
jgi:hypothetical protein